MMKEIMHREAADNVYLHKDFHGALSCAIEYLHVHYGEEAVREYLHDFAASYYAPLHDDLCRRGLAALQEHFARIYASEGQPVEMTLATDELILRVPASPAIRHMHSKGYPVARMFAETVRTIITTICENTPFAAELREYDEDTGASLQRFYRRPA
jgi:hypothetical protein